MHRLFALLSKVLFKIFGLLPLQKKVVATTMFGKKYGDNPQFIIEKLHDIDPSIDFVWLVNKEYSVNVPSWVRVVSFKSNYLNLIYELSTASVWINSHIYGIGWHRRKDQLVIETFHGGLGVKKIEFDAEYVRTNKILSRAVKHTCEIADVFISNSDFLSNLYRRAFGYKGPIYKCGYPKNDILINRFEKYKTVVREELGIPLDKKILLYAPTFRESFEKYGQMDLSVYCIDFDKVQNAVEKRFGGTWISLVKYHPILVNYIKNNKGGCGGEYKDVTSYNNMQALLMASDLVISDYSSSIFDAALLSIPCLTFARDFEQYKQERGVYYEMEELPFPYAQTNDELVKNILEFNIEENIERWNKFCVETGLHETGHAAQDIALKINKFLCGNKCISWDDETE